MFRRDDGGQSVVLIAISLPLVLSLLLIVIDGGRLYVDRERIRNAAQLAAEAAVSLAADTPGRSQPNDQKIRDIVKEALDRNLPGETFSHSVTMPFRTDITTFNVKVSVTKPFRASVQSVGFTIGADGAAKLGDASSLAVTGASQTPAPAPSPTPAPTPTAQPTPSPTAATPSPSPSPTPRLSVTISSLYYTAATLGASYYTACPTPSLGCYRPTVRLTYPPGAHGSSYYTDGQPGIGFYTPAGETHVYRVDFGYPGGRKESISVPITWPLNGSAYRSTSYSVTVTR